jgi:hypothetical protein
MKNPTSAKRIEADPVRNTDEWTKTQPSPIADTSPYLESSSSARRIWVTRPARARGVADDVRRSADTSTRVYVTKRV